MIIIGIICWITGFSNGYNYSKKDLKRFIEEEIELIQDNAKLFGLDQWQIIYQQKLHKKLKDLNDNS